MSVPFSEKNSEATCKTCQRHAVDGDLEVREFNVRRKGTNQTGQPKLTARQREFARHPTVTTNPRQAAIDSGYSESFAKSGSQALRRQMAPLIMQYQEAAKKITAISVAKVQTELASMGFANILDYYNIATDGVVTPKMLNELTREQAAAIQEVEVVPLFSAELGRDIMVIGKIKLADKRANLVELGKTLGMFSGASVDDKRESTLYLQDAPTEALEDAERLLMTAIATARAEKSKRNAIEGEYIKE